MISEEMIVQYMMLAAADNVFPGSAEVNMTALAEDAAHHFGHDEWLDDEGHYVWDAAVEVAEEWEESQ